MEDDVRRHIRLAVLAPGLLTDVTRDRVPDHRRDAWERQTGPCIYSTISPLRTRFTPSKFDVEVSSIFKRQDVRVPCCERMFYGVLSAERYLSNSFSGDPIP